MSALIESFVAHFGEMGSRWGINRTVGQVYALLFISEEALHAEDIAEKLSISRSNVSMSLKELESWQIVRLIRIPGDRREYYTSLENVWDIFQAIAAERRRREIEPTLSMLRQSLIAEAETDADAYAQKRIREMHQLADLANNWFDELQRLSPESLMQLMRLGRKVNKLLLIKDRAKASITGKEL